MGCIIALISTKQLKQGSHWYHGYHLWYGTAGNWTRNLLLSKLCHLSYSDQLNMKGNPYVFIQNKILHTNQCYKLQQVQKTFIKFKGKLIFRDKRKGEDHLLSKWRFFGCNFLLFFARVPDVMSSLYGPWLCGQLGVPECYLSIQSWYSQLFTIRTEWYSQHWQIMMNSAAWHYKYIKYRKVSGIACKLIILLHP